MTLLGKFRTRTTRSNEAFSADQIDDHVWLGDLDSSLHEDALNRLNINYIVTVLDFQPTIPLNDRRIRMHIHAIDVNEHDLMKEFDSAYEFINKAVSRNGNVLIHCHAGET